MERGEIFMAQKLKQINDISIGDNLRKLRNAANLTQEQVVAQLQLRNLPTSRSVYSQIEAGTYNIRISELIALAEIFHTDFNTNFQRSDTRQIIPDNKFSSVAWDYFMHKYFLLPIQPIMLFLFV